VQPDVAQACASSPGAPVCRGSAPVAYAKINSAERATHAIVATSRLVLLILTYHHHYFSKHASAFFAAVLKGNSCNLSLDSHWNFEGMRTKDARKTLYE